MSLGLLLYFWQEMPRNSPEDIFAILFGMVFVVAMMTEKDTQVAATTRAVLRQRLLFGRIPVSSAQSPNSVCPACQVGVWDLRVIWSLGFGVLQKVLVEPFREDLHVLVHAEPVVIRAGLHDDPFRAWCNSNLNHRFRH